KEELNYLIARAHDAGLKTMVHVNSPKGIMMALEAGADSIEHAYGIDDECIEAFTEKNCIWVPTLAPFANIADCDGKHALSKYKKVSERYFKEHCAQVKKAHEKGVSIALGSDSGASLVLHARGCYDELKYLNQCGLDEIELFNNCCKVMDLNKKTINC
ncbi:MAG: amidohydrolase family protein, partial [Eubacterium sp.]